MNKKFAVLIIITIILLPFSVYFQYEYLTEKQREDNISLEQKQKREIEIIDGDNIKPFENSISPPPTIPINVENGPDATNPFQNDEAPPEQNSTWTPPEA